MTESETVNLRNAKKNSHEPIVLQMHCQTVQLWMTSACKCIGVCECLSVCACVYWLKKLHNLDTAAAVPRVWSARASIDFVWFCKYTGDDEYDHTHTHASTAKCASTTESMRLCVSMQRMQKYSSPFTITDWLTSELATQILPLLRFRVAKRSKNYLTKPSGGVLAAFFSCIYVTSRLMKRRKNTVVLKNQ